MVAWRSGTTQTKVGVATEAHSQSPLAQEREQAGGGARKVRKRGCGMWGYGQGSDHVTIDWNIWQRAISFFFLKNKILYQYVQNDMAA